MASTHSDPAISTLLQLPSLRRFLTSLQSLINSSAPPPCIHIHAPSNASLVLPILHHLLRTHTRPSTSHDRPSVQSLLPRYALVELDQVHSTRQAFDRVLNQFSAFVDENGYSFWDEGKKAASNWDGRIEGCHVVKVKRAKRAPGSRREGCRNRKKARRDGVCSSEEEQEEQDSEEVDGEMEEEGSEWRIEWDRSIPPTREPIAPIHDTLDHFYTSLATIFSLGNTTSDDNAMRDDADADSDSEEFAAFARRTTEPSRQAHRFIVFDQAEMLSDLPSAGNIGGAPKETGLGMTFVSAMKRLGSLSRLPVSTIMVSKLAPTKSREGMVGNVEPYLLVFPELSASDPSSRSRQGRDVVALLKARFASTSPATETLNTEQTVELFGSLVSVIWDVFSKTHTEINSLAHLAAKYWPKWVECVEKSNPRVDPGNTSALLSHLRADFAREHERHGAPRQSLYSNSNGTSPTKAAISEAPLHGFVGSMPDLPSGPTYLPTTSSSVASPFRASTSTAPSFDAPTPSNDLFTPSTPLRKQAAEITSSSSIAARKAKADQTLAKSLPLVARILIVSAFYAAFNPSKSDVRFFVKIDEAIAKKGKKGRRGRRAKVGLSPSKATRTAFESGGKAFALERLLAIFEALLDEPVVSSTIDVQMQVTTLVNLRLLQRVSALDKVLDGAKLKCRVGLETVDMLAKSCGMKDWKTRLYSVEV